VHYATRVNSEPVLRLLHGAGANLRLPCAEGTVLHIAASRGYADLIRVLLQLEPKLDRDARAPNGETPLLTAAQCGQTGAAAALLAAGASPR